MANPSIERPLRLAMVGVGWAGDRQTRACRELVGQVIVECLVDKDAAFLSQKARELGVAKTHASLDDALCDPDVDAVSLCVPHRYHHPMALQACRAGKHVLVEKPMAINVGEATEMIDVARAEGVVLYVAENAVYTPECAVLRHIVQSGERIGALTSAAYATGFNAPEYGYPGRRAWLSTPKAGGSGVWLLNGIHTVARLRYILGEVAVVYMGEHKGPSFSREDVEGTMSGLLTLESGVHVWVLQSPETRLRGVFSGFRLHGEEGSVIATDERYAFLGNEAVGADPLEWHGFPDAELSSYALELLAFRQAVAGRAIGPTTGESERRSLSVVQAGYESAASGKPIHLRERFGPL